MVSYDCRFCSKEFKDKGEYMRHKNRKFACISQKKYESEHNNLLERETQTFKLIDQIRSMEKNHEEEKKLLNKMIETIKMENKAQREQIKFYTDKLVPHYENMVGSNEITTISTLTEKYKHIFENDTDFSDPNLFVALNGYVLAKFPKYVNSRLLLDDYIIGQQMRKLIPKKSKENVQADIIKIFFDNNTHIRCPVCSVRTIDVFKCGKQTAHIIPDHMDGPYESWNLVPSCACNALYKNNLIDYMGMHKNPLIQQNLYKLIKKMRDTFAKVLFEEQNMGLYKFCKYAYFPKHLNQYRHLLDKMTIIIKLK